MSNEIYGFCPNCGTEANSGQRFCVACGESLPTHEIPTSPSNTVLPAPPGPQANPTYNYGATPPLTTTNGMSVASLVLGLVWLGGIGSILAIVFGNVGHKQIRDSGGRQTGNGMASWGIALGILGLVGTVIFTVLLISAANDATACQNRGGIYEGNGVCFAPNTGTTGTIP